jgi:hypothetical protein
VSREEAEKALGSKAVGQVVEPAIPRRQKSQQMNHEQPSTEKQSTLREPEQPVRLETLFVSANQIRLARAELKHRQDEGELDEDDYIQKVSNISKLEDELQEELIKYDKAISQDQQDFIIDYSGGSYDELLVSPVSTAPNSFDTNTTTTPPNNGTVKYKSKSIGIDDKTQTEAEESGGGSDALSEPSGPELIVVEASQTEADPDTKPGPQSFDTWPTLDDSQSKSTSFDTTGGAEEVQTDFVITDENPFEKAELISDPELEKLWSGLGEKEQLATELMSADSALYSRYVTARETFIREQANARGAGIPSNEQKVGWIQRFRNTISERFRKDQQQATSQEIEGFDSIYGQALNSVVQGYGPMSPDDEFNLRRDLESDAASRLEWDISKTKFEATKDKQQSRARQALKLGGYALIAAAAGGVTAVVERYNNSGGHKWYALGAGVFGALAGLGAARGYQPQEDESSIGLNSITAWEAVMKEYSRGSLDSLKERTVGIEGAQTVTKNEKRKSGARYLGAAAIGAAAGVGGHYLVELGWPWISSIRDINTSNPNIQSEDISFEGFDILDTDHSGDIDPGVDVPDLNDDGAITVEDIPNPLDTDHSGKVEPGVDMPDRNGDGVITVDDQFEWSDTNQDGVTNSEDMPDTNDDGVIDRRDQQVVEEYGSLDTNHDGETDGQDVPDRNGDDVIDINDVPEYPDGETAPQTQEQAPPPPPEVQVVEAGQDIYIEPGSSITNEADQFTLHAYNVDLDQSQLDNMYHDLFEVGEYKPEQVFEDVEFYPMEDGRYGMVDVGHATLTPFGQEVIEDWLTENQLYSAA